MITDYLNQTAAWAVRTGKDGYGQPTYAAATNINCRWEDKQRLIRNSQGAEIVSQATCYCIENVKEYDQLTYDGRVYIVLSVADQPLMDGTINHREVYL